jgi:tRNA threonylcarbamoyladenosine biosynthesis protein TsaE
LSRSPAETEGVGETIGRRLGADEAAAGADLLLLHGPLGAGKTCFVRGLARGLDCTVVPRSPTFALHRSYPGRRVLHHLDLYRLHGQSLEEIGLDELLAGPGVVVVEWGERLGERAPLDALHLTFTPEPDESRRIRIEAPAAVIERFVPVLERLGGG